MQSTKWLGIDFGTVRLGFACADQKTAIAFPITTYTRQGEKGTQPTSKNWFGKSR